MNLLELSKKLDTLADQLPAIANDVAKEFTKALSLELISVTPVDVSTALSNWQVGIDSPPSSFIDAHTPGVGGSTQAASAAEAWDLAKIAADKGRPGQSYWLSNNTPYIIDLNSGTSRQAPSMFIQKAIAYTLQKQLPVIAKRVINDYRKRRY